jgi:hypothetical protein
MDFLPPYYHHIENYAYFGHNNLLPLVTDTRSWPNQYQIPISNTKRAIANPVPSNVG